MLTVHLAVLIFHFSVNTSRGEICCGSSVVELKSNKSVGESGIWSGALIRIYTGSRESAQPQPFAAPQVPSASSELPAMAIPQQTSALSSSLNQPAQSGGVHKRLLKELNDLKANPPAHYTVGPVGNDIFQWEASTKGPDNTPYAGGVFRLKLDIPTDYPFKPPKTRFTTKVYHPNIYENGYSCCRALYESWSPLDWTLSKVVEMHYQLLVNPDLTHGFGQAMQLYQSNRAEFDRVAREWTAQYAK